LSQQGKGKGKSGTMRPHEILFGSIDMHLHCAPDTVPRKLDALELARKAKDAGMKAIVLKSHTYPTAPLATMVEKALSGIKVFGGLALNDSVGGINPQAVKSAIALGAKVIWMPTISARHQLKGMRTTSARAHMAKLGRGAGDGITILNASGEVIPEVVEIIALVEEANIILASGHLSLEERKALVKEARRAGLRKFVVTHPEFDLTRMSNQEQKELLRYGAFFERCYFAATELGGSLNPSIIAESINEVGPESTILSSDLGQVGNPDPLEGFRRYVQQMLGCGIREEALHLMIRENPSRLLGI
jgi:hypothetical protein